MRVLYLGAFQSSWSTENYIARALERAGCELTRLEETEATQESIIEAARSRSPEVLLFAKGRFQGANQVWPDAATPLTKMLEGVRPQVGRIVCWLFDLLAREFAANRFAWASRVAAACDLFLTTDGYTAPQLSNARVLRQGAPDDLDESCAWQIEPEIDVLFLGTPYRDRQFLVQALSRRFGERFQHETNCRGPQLTRLVRSARLCIGPHDPHFARYWSNRLYVVAGHGGLFAAPAVPGMAEEGWRAGEHYLSLPREPEQMTAKLEEYVTQHDAAQLETIRRRGYEFARAHCRYDDRVRELLALLQSPHEPASDTASSIE